MSTIAHATSQADILRCYPVMVQLRPHVEEKDFVARVKRQQQGGYELVFLEDGGSVRSVAGFRIAECLAWGKILYVDDLLTAEQSRSRGYGEQLFRWLTELARDRGCDQLHLDSGVQRFGAHRFYLANRMDIIAHHFGMRLE
jgi:GNAT superfamily N-acetyltransferase